MSLALLKNALFPRPTPGSRVGWQEPNRRPMYQCSEKRDTEPTNCPLPPRPKSLGSDASTTIDLEKCGDCSHNHDHFSTGFPKDVDQHEPEEKKSRFKLSARMISDAIIGLSDGMTVPFALTAGLSSLGSARLVVLGGLAELIAGAISMGLGGFIGAKSEADSYKASVKEVQKLIDTSPYETQSIVNDVFKPYGLSSSVVSTISRNLHQSPAQLLDFLMRFHRQELEPDGSRPWVCAATIAVSYFIGGFIPLFPYLLVHSDQVLTALWISIGVMVFALFVFGWVKTGVVSGWTGRKCVVECLVGALQMVVVGAVAAGAAVGLVRAIDRGGSTCS